MILHERAHSRGRSLHVRGAWRGLSRCFSTLAILVLASSAVWAGQPLHQANANSASCEGRWPCDLGGPFVLTDYLRKPRSSKVISGVCFSRCTIALIAGACVTDDAELGFHAVTDMFGNVDHVATETVESLYPLGLRKWIRRAGAMNSVRITTLSGAQAIRLGVPACSRRRVISARAR